uniref:Uncharacterized protein n=1 Tax=Cacopsylla melanoneura TaxID=428564 RepID=A0A8D8TII4_9HEMI
MRNEVGTRERDIGERIGMRSVGEEGEIREMGGMRNEKISCNKEINDEKERTKMGTENVGEKKKKNQLWGSHLFLWGRSYSLVGGWRLVFSLGNIVNLEFFKIKRYFFIFKKIN